jgi:uncharacterized membrane protein YhaH (DUF805 family)
MTGRYLDRALLVSLFAMALFLLLPTTALAQSQDGGGILGAIGGAIGCLIGLISFAITVALTVWVYRDANARGQNGILWGLLTFFFTLIGLIAWLIVRRDKPRIA